MLLCSIFLWCLNICHCDVTAKSGELQLIVSNRNEIYRFTPKIDPRDLYLTDATAIVDVDYHFPKNLLFWIDSAKNEIHSQPLDGNSPHPHMIFQQKTAWAPVALAVDFIADKIYVADKLGAKVDLFELDGKFHGILTGFSLVSPLDVKIDPYEGLLFILDGNRIVRVKPDGSSPRTIFPRDIAVVYGFSVDMISKQIYWAQRNNSQVMRSDYAGENVTPAGKTNNTSLWSKFAVLNETVYWTSDFVNFTAEACDKRPGVAVLKSIYESNPAPAIRILHSSLQKSVANPCGDSNGGCQHMCVSSDKYDAKNVSHYRCACAVGWKLAENLKNCTLVDDFLLYAQPKIIKSHVISECISASCVPYLPVTSDRNAFADFDYQPTTGYLYYISADRYMKADKVYRVRLDGDTPELFLSGDSYQSLSVNVRTDDLYFIDQMAGTIEVVNTKNKSDSRILLKNLTDPYDIVVHANASYLFFLQNNQSTGMSILTRARLDGSNLTTFRNVTLKNHCGFALDFEDDRIYWYEWRSMSIHHADLNLNDTQSIQTDLTRYAQALYLFREWVYIVTTKSEGLWRFDKKTGGKKELIVADFSNRISKIKVFKNMHQLENKTVD